MTAREGASRGPEKAHVTVDPGMGPFYDWFVTADRRYRARELINLARLGFKYMELEGKEGAADHKAAPAASRISPALPAAAQGSQEPEGFDELLSFGGGKG